MKNIVTDGELGKLAIKLHEVFTRVKNGALPIRRVLYGLQKIIEGDGPILPEDFPKKHYGVWGTVEIGGVDSSEFLERDDVSASPGRVRNVIFQKEFKTQVTKEVLDLIMLTPEDFGYIEPPEYKELIDPEMLASWSAKNLSGYVLDICPTEVAPHLLSQHPDPSIEFFRVAMQPVCDGNGVPVIFGLVLYHFGIRLSVSDFYSKDNLYLDSKFVFRLRKIETE